MILRLINKECSRDIQNIINIIASVINMLMVMVVGFFLSPYIVQTIGVEANGFVTLANNFMSYATLAKMALDSMGSRFIMVAYHKGEYKKVEQYYSSLFWGDALFGLALAILSAVCIWKLEVILEIPLEIVADVKLLFALLFSNFIISGVLSVWSVAPYVKNKLYLNSFSSMISHIVRAAVIVGLFLTLDPSVCFVGIGTLVAGILLQILQRFYKTALLPEIKAKIENFSWTAVKLLVSSGIWNSISMLGNILMNGFDLLLANVFVGATDMGVLALAQTIPSIINELNLAISSSFAPSLIMDYARGKTEETVKTLRQASKILAVICSLPLAFLLVYGKELFSLWQPTQNAQFLYILSVITVFGQVLFIGMRPLYQVYTVTNKVKQNSLAHITTGLVSIILTVVLLEITNLGVYAIAGISVACTIVENIVFVIPYAAKYLNLNKNTFFYTIGYSVAPCVSLYLMGIIERFFVPARTWGQLLAAGIVFVCVGFGLTVLIILNKAEREYLFDRIRSIIKR